jgi:glycosyltransferase involved in cell wall biosynthesis
MSQIESLVSVIFPVNKVDANTLTALQSVVSQSYRNLEILVIDTSERSGSGTFVDFYDLIKSDPRIRHESLPVNLNLSQSLNHGLKVCRGDFIARMDADDICFIDRIQTQLEYLARNPDVDILGSAIQIIGGFEGHSFSHGLVITPPTRDVNLLYWALEKNPIFHPTVIFRRAVCKDAVYNPRYQRAQDYELWIRLLRKYEIDNIEFPLLYYRVHPNQAGVLGSSDSKYYSTLAQLKHAIWMILRKKGKTLPTKVFAKRVLTLVKLFLKKKIKSSFLL